MKKSILLSMVLSSLNVANHWNSSALAQLNHYPYPDDDINMLYCEVYDLLRKQTRIIGDIRRHMVKVKNEQLKLL